MAKKEYYLDIGLQNNKLTNFVVDPVSTDPTTGKVEGRLIYNDSTKNIKFYDGSVWRFVGADQLDELSDTDFTGWTDSVNGQYLIYNSATKKWKPGEFNQRLEHLSNVNLGAVSGQVLGYDGTNWKGVAPSGGLGINNAGEFKLVLSGKTSSQNLEASDEVTYRHGLSGVFSAFSVHNDPVNGNLPCIRTKLDNPAPVKTMLGVIGINGPQISLQGINAGIAAWSTEPHVNDTEQGTLLQFLSNPKGGNALVTGMVQSDTGNVIIRPVSVHDSYPETALHVRGGVSFPSHVTTLTNYTIDSRDPNDRYVLMNMLTNTARTITFPNPGTAYEGRVLTVKVIKNTGITQNVTLQTAGGVANGFYTTRGSATQTLTISGQYRTFVCSEMTGGFWTWLQFDNNTSD